MYLIPKKAVYVILAVVATIILTAVICNAESVVVSFNDAEQLAAISDSIVGVCDTVVKEITYLEHGYWGNRWGDGSVETFIRDDSCETYRTYPVIETIITCRELVSRTVVPEPSRAATYLAVRHKAIITWKEVKK